MATLCYEGPLVQLSQKRYILRLVTFGSPRVIGAYNFKRVWVRWHGATLYVNGSDIVTEVPPVIFGFRHVAKTKHIGDKKTLFGYFKPKKYHHIDGYIERLGDVTCKDNFTNCPKGIQNEKDIERLGERVALMFDHLSEGLDKLDKKIRSS